MRPIVVTGAAGFIGHALSKRLLAEGHRIVGVDAVTPYYDVRLKEARLAELAPHRGFALERFDLADAPRTEALLARLRPERVVHLAAQPGVRYSLEQPRACLEANVNAFLNVLEGCRRAGVGHLVYASSSSVYGGNTKVPFSVEDRVDRPISVYAATKRTNELLAHVYSHVHGLPATGLRFFTVYGPWGRPDMAPMLFTRAIDAGEPIRIFNRGDMRRDFTYVDDVVESVVRLLARPPPARDGAGAEGAPYRLYNVGNSTPVELMRFVAILERLLGRKARRVLEPMQPGDVPATYADVADLEREVRFRPRTSIEEGLARLVEWYLASPWRARPAPARRAARPRNGAARARAPRHGAHAPHPAHPPTSSR
jgi:UDP-glucuronate 4-epimerase